jgi:hypothetical protein
LLEGYWIKSLEHQSLLFNFQHSLNSHVLTRLCKDISYLKPSTCLKNMYRSQFDWCPGAIG